MLNSITIPTQKDPIARLSLIGCALAICYAAFVSATAPAPASAQTETDPIIIVATPALPTAEPTPPMNLGAITAPTAEVIYVEVPGPTPEPQVVYIQTQTEPPAQPQTLAPPVEVAPAFDPVAQPGQAAEALTNAYQSLPVLQCPCGGDTPPNQPTARDYAYSKARTR